MKPKMNAVRHCTLHEDGREKVDKTPLSLSVKCKPRPMTLMEMHYAIKRLSAEEAAQAGMETFEEADDFDCDEEDDDPTTPYELNFDQINAPARQRPKTSFREDRPEANQKVNGVTESEKQLTDKTE